MREGHEEPNTQAIDEPCESTHTASVDASGSTPSHVVSVKKLEANRRNAQHSTGPRTPEGKAAVRGNAIKHGLLATDMIASMAKLGEDPTEFTQVLDEFSEALQPAGRQEELCVERAAVAYWRKRRAIRAEAGETCRYRQAQEKAVGELDFSSRMFLKDYAQLHEALAGPSVSDDTLEACNHLGYEVVKPLVKAVRKRQAAVTGTSDPVEQETARAGLADAVAQLRSQLERCKNWLDQKVATMDEELKIAHSVAAIPPSTVIAHLLRYESMHSHECERAMKELHRLQRDRLKASTARTTPSTQLHRAG